MHVPAQARPHGIPHATSKNIIGTNGSDRVSHCIRRRSMKKPPAIAVVLLVIASLIALPARSAACPMFLSLWDVIDQADWIALVRVARIEVEPDPGNPAAGVSEEHEVAVLEALGVWKGPSEIEARVDLEPGAPAPYAEGDLVVVFLERGESRAKRLRDANAPTSREELLELGVEEEDVAQILETSAEEQETSLRFESWAQGRWLHVSERALPESDADLAALREIVRTAARLQAAVPVSFEDRLDWLVSVVERRAFRDEALYSLLPQESSLTEEQLARLAGAFLGAPSVDASDIDMLNLLARYEGAEVDMAAASVVEAALGMSPIPGWATSMVDAALRRYGDDFSERIGRDDRDPAGRLVYMEGTRDTLPTIWAVARRDLGIPEMPPAERPLRPPRGYDPHALD